MKVADLDPAMAAFLYAREALRRLGFSADDIFAEISTKGGDVVMPTGEHIVTTKPVIVLVLREDEKTFNWPIGVFELDASKVDAHFNAASELWNSGKYEAEFQRGWENSFARKNGVRLCEGLVAKGFVIRASKN